MLAMELRKAWNIAVLAGLALGVGTGGCSRDHIEAINLANEGDRQIGVNVEGAIQSYERARQLDASNHRIIYKLARAYEKKEDWEKMASVLAQATQQAPEFANYWFKRGYALVRMAEAGDKDKYEEAKAPLQECIKRDPNYAECYHWLAVALEWTDDPQAALQNYTAAIEHNPEEPYFYPDPASLYVTYRLYGEAEQILKEGVRMVPATEDTRDNLYEMQVLLFEVYQAKNDMAGMVAAAEAAQQLGQDAHPESWFLVGSTYAKMEPPQKEKAVRMLNSFTKRTCRSAKSVQFKEQCETAASLLQQLGGTGG
jgi:tetratricopeptide (TPR) repeat protein